MKKVFGKFKSIINIVLFVIALFNICVTYVYAEASVIYAPTKGVVEESVVEDDKTITPESEVVSYLVEDTTNADYVRIYNVYQDENGNIYCYDHGNPARNVWRKISLHSFSEFAPVENFTHDYIWAYFGSNGKAIKANSGKIRKTKIGNNTYAFNEYGQMIEGYFNDDAECWNGGDGDPFDLLNGNNYLYYADVNNGVLASGWHKYIYGTEKYENKDNIWLYFSPSNFRGVRATGTSYKSTNIDGKTYAFDNNGVMLTGFEAMQYNYDNGGSMSKITYFSKDGEGIKSGFAKVDLSDDLNNQIYEDSDEDIMIYLSKSGMMYKNTIKKIGSYYYGFDERGAAIRGLSVWNGTNFVSTIQPEDTDGKAFIIYGQYKDKNGNSHVLANGEKVHFFDNMGRRLLSTNIEFSNERYTYKANNSGGFNGLSDKKFYVNGLLMKPTSDTKYGIYIMGANTDTYSFNQVAGNQNAYVVNSSGTRQTSATGVKDGNDDYWLLSGSGHLVNIYNVPVKYSGGSYYFKSENSNGSDTWILFGNKDASGRTCVADVVANGTRLANGAIASFQVRPTDEVALNFYFR